MVMVRAGICYRQQTQVHFIDGILNAQRYRDEILRAIVVPSIYDHHLMLQHDNARPHVAKKPSILSRHVTNSAGLGCSGYNMYTICIQQHVPVPANIQQLHTAIEEEWTNIPQATINYPINSIQRRCDANGGHTRSHGSQDCKQGVLQHSGYV